ncbi:MAG: hypothetical protein K2X45_03595 [Phreatobacter sp.]|nr:hypothetical protein [Phreatobacter sp.]
MRPTILALACLSLIAGPFDALAQTKGKTGAETPPGANGQQADGQPADITGTWAGTYTCLQGRTGLTLTIDEASPERVRATFHFYADPSNPAVPSGCFSQTGRYDPATRRLTLAGGRWIVRPRDYETVGLTGTLDRVGAVLSGRVTQAEGCTTFRLERRPHPETAPVGCGVSAGLR